MKRDRAFESKEQPLPAQDRCYSEILDRMEAAEESLEKIEP